jgi:hypothetical protein
MSRNGSGTYTLPAGNPVVTGTTISSTWSNNTLTDIATALTGSLAADGQTTATGNLKMGSNRITGLADGLVSTDAATLSQVTAAIAGAQPVITTIGILKGAGAGSISAAVSGTDYCPATSGSSILKGSSGGTTAAVAGTDYAGISNVQTFTAGQRGEVTALTSASTITPNLADSNNFSLTLATNATLANPTNIVAGQSGVITITQDATGSRTLAYGSYWKFADATAPTLTTTADAVDVLVYYVESSTRITASLINNVG